MEIVSVTSMLQTVLWTEWRYKMKFFNRKISFQRLNEYIGRRKASVNYQENRKDTRKDLYFLILCFGMACMVNFTIESISRHSFAEAFHYLIKSWDVFLYNTYLIFVTLTISYLVRKRIFASIVISFVWLIGGIANGVILACRVTPFTGNDLKMIGNAASVVKKYMSVDQILLAVLLTLAAIGFFVLAALWCPKFQGKMRYQRYIAFLILAFVSILPVTKLCIRANVLSTYFGNIAIGYEDYGFPYSFLSTIFVQGIDRPDHYQESEVKKIIREDGKDHYRTKENPNIIIVQLESFFDPSLIKGMEYSKDPIPNFHKLEEDYTSGYVRVPVVGAGTANTEFEVLTGMSMRYFGTGEYPYKTVMRDNVCESIAYVLKNLGYSTHAIHNNIASFYGRDEVFARLGFDTFTSLEMMDIEDYPPLGWAKDAKLTDSVMECLKSTEGQDLVYTITVQSHGGYPSEPVAMNQPITVHGTEGEEDRNYSIEYYVNQLYEVDQFIGNLVKELEKFDEDTILVLFGDHQPSLGLESDQLACGSLFKTNYVIWDNMGLPKEDRDLASYQLVSIAFDKVGIHAGTLMKYHQERMGTKRYWSDLKVLQYDMLYGKKYVYNGEDRYDEADLQMGIEDITITSIKVDLHGNTVIKGNDFNAYSRIAVNGKEMDTVYVDRNTLALKNHEINRGDVLEVNQVSHNGNILRKGTAYTYQGYQRFIKAADRVLN